MQRRLYDYRHANASRKIIRLHTWLWLRPGPPGIGLPGEEEGILLPVKDVGPVEHANISFGQGIAVTPLQMIGMVGAVANGGLLMKPQIVREIKSADGGR